MLLHSIAVVALSSAVIASSRHASIIQNASPGISFTVAQKSHSSLIWSKFTRPHRQAAVHAQTIHGSRGIRGKKTNAKSAAAILGAHQRATGGTGYENITTTSAYGTQYATEVNWSGRPMYLLLDTGSSDTWAIHKDFDCTDYIGESVPQVACGFGPAYPETFQHGKVTPEQHMYIRYGDGEVVTGPMGFADITVGNITATKQQVCLANSTYWYGNNMTSGLMGLGYPALTNSYLGTQFDHSRGNRMEYSPFFTTLVNQGNIKPIFSMAIDRNASTGTLALGGVAPAPGVDTSTVAIMDMLIVNLINSPEASYEYSFYTIVPDGWAFDKSTHSKHYPYIVDSGTTLCYLPPEIATEINAAFQPPAGFFWSYGAFFTSCDAIPPPVAVVLDGKKFWFNPVDLIYRDMIDPETKLCMTAISSGGSGPFILGDAFLQNALVVFDVGEAEIRFMPRTYY
ncbi:hypothetical protein OQA88_8943 [Cercophora sp. LCS_1]